MRTHIDTTDPSRTLNTAEARALLARVEGSKVISLGVLSGTDLCALGAPEHPVCWDPLKFAWLQLDQNERQQFAETGMLRLRHRGLLKEQPPGGDVEALIIPASFRMSAELTILLGARKSPALIIATHHESRIPPITYFQPHGTSAFVEEIPERADTGTPGSLRSPLDVIFSYRLLTRDFAAAELARWALKPIPVAKYQPKPPRLIAFFCRTEEGGGPASYQLAINGNGEEAHVDGPGISADLGSQELTRFMSDIVTEWADSR